MSNAAMIAAASSIYTLLYLLSICAVVIGSNRVTWCKLMLNVGLFTPFETGKIVRLIIIFRLMFPLFKVKLVGKKAIHLYGVS